MKTKDPVNQDLIEHEINSGYEKLGLMNSKVWSEDPKRLIFTLSRYKFVSKMFNGIDSVLEVGCGDGRNLPLFKDVGLTTYGVEISDEICNHVTSELEKINLSDILVKTGTTQSIPFEDNFFDVVYSKSLMEHLRHPDSYLKEVFRILKPGGTIRTIWPPHEFIDKLLSNQKLTPDQEMFCAHYHNFYVLHLMVFHLYLLNINQLDDWLQL